MNTILRPLSVLLRTASGTVILSGTPQASTKNFTKADTGTRPARSPPRAASGRKQRKSSGPTTSCISMAHRSATQFSKVTKHPAFGKAASGQPSSPPPGARGSTAQTPAKQQPIATPNRYRTQTCSPSVAANVNLLATKNRGIDRELSKQPGTSGVPIRSPRARVRPAAAEGPERREHGARVGLNLLWLDVPRPSPRTDPRSGRHQKGARR